MKTWKGQKPLHTLAIKLDGVQAMLRDGVVVTRSGNPLHNIDPAHLETGKRYEVFLGSLSETTSVVRSLKHERKVQRHELYEIAPGTDSRLMLPLTDEVERVFAEVTAQGHEGLVIDQTYKLKAVETYDVEIIGVRPAKAGKYFGLMGALLTPMGKVGTGFTKQQRAQSWRIGDLIEVECMQLTEKGRFRHARFVRHRWDKN